MKLKNAYFAAGCFWGIELRFFQEPGVVNTRVGYMGGNNDYDILCYDEVCKGNTGHAETVEITYDPDVISYKSLLEIFWKIHNPTLLNRQGPDIGTQYRSAIFYTDDYQKLEAEISIKEIRKFYNKPIVTELIPKQRFYIAEEYHQKYLIKNKEAVCHI